MIFFLVTNENRQTMDWYLSSRGKKIITLIQLLEYERIFKKDKFLPGVYIFSDLGLLSDDQRKQAVQIWDELKEQYPGQAVLLNHPAKAKRRYDLLKHLHAKEINRFNTYRLNENLSEIKFPVMFRYQADNSGNPATLLHNHDELNQAVASVKETVGDISSWAVTEYCDTSDDHGIFRKYGAFMIGETVVPRHVLFSQNWFQKYDDIYNEQCFKEELAYLQENPHAESIKRIFREANMDYGRIDYSCKDGVIQVWEINSNPNLFNLYKKYHPLRRPANDLFAQKIESAWRELASAYKGPNVNYAGERTHMLYNMINSRRGYKKLLSKVRKIKGGITKVCPQSLTIYKKIKSALRRS